MVLLDKLARKKPADVRYVVAHYDHGIRENSGEDAEFVQQIAKNLQFEFACERGRLGPKASEELARERRYAFLSKVQKKHNALRIVTAHHQDDVIETMIINMLRGTGPRGLIALRSSANVLRPLLKTPKSELINYAKTHHVQWREDETNKNDDYLRNYVRHTITSKLNSDQRTELLLLRKKIADNYFEINGLLEYASSKESSLERQHLLHFNWRVQKEIVRYWLLANQVRDLDRPTIERLSVQVKTLKPGKKTDIDARFWMIARKKTVEIQSKSRG